MTESRALVYRGERGRSGVSFATESGVGGWVSWQQVDQDGCDLAARLAAIGVSGPDRPTVVVGATSPQLVTAIRAVLESGSPVAVLAPLDRRRRGSGGGELARQVEGLAPCVVLCAEPVGERWAEAGWPGKPVARLGALTVIEVPGEQRARGEGGHGSDTGHVPGHEPAVLLQYTSGSTQAPRPVVVSRENLLANIAGMVERLGYDPATDRLLSWLPLYHDMGLIGFLLLSMLEGIDLVLADAGLFLRRPASWLRWVSESRATVTGAPQFAYSVTGRRRTDLGDVDLSCLRVAINGAEQVDPAGVRRFLDLTGAYGLGPGAMTCAYGLAEATLAVSAAEPGTGMVTDHGGGDGGRSVELAVLGAPLRGVEVRVVNADRQPVDARQVGEIEVGGPSVTSGFWPLGRADRHAGDGWLATGDLGYLTTDGELVVWGRSKDVVVIAGRNYSPVEIERVAATVRGIRPGNVAAFGVPNPSGGTEALVVVAETADARAGLTQDVRAAVRHAFAVVPREVVLLPPGALPKTTSGKVRRAATRALFETDSF